MRAIELGKVAGWGQCAVEAKDMDQAGYLYLLTTVWKLKMTEKTRQLRFAAVREPGKKRLISNKKVYF